MTTEKDVQLPSYGRTRVPAPRRRQSAVRLVGGVSAKKGGVDGRRARDAT